MKTWFEDLMSAITFAEEGEHETARGLLKSTDTVLLAISDSMFDGSALRYAVNISKRVKAHLEILYVTGSEEEDRGLKDLVSEVKKVGFGFSLVKKKGCVKKAILDYTQNRSEIVFVVVGSTFELDIGCRENERSVSDAWKELRCPLVVVSKGRVPSPA